MIEIRVKSHIKSQEFLKLQEALSNLGYTIELIGDTSKVGGIPLYYYFFAIKRDRQVNPDE